METLGPDPQENNEKAKVEKINTRNEKLLPIKDPSFIYGNILTRNIRANPYIECDPIQPLILPISFPIARSF